MQDVYKNIEEYNSGKRQKILIVFDDLIPDMIRNRILNPVVTELSIRGRKLKLTLAFTTESYLKYLKMLTKL